MTDGTDARTPLRPSRTALALLIVAVAIQIWSVYAPDSPATPTFAHEDKIAHALLFGAPVAIAWAAGLRPRLVTALMGLHAPVSELIQHYVLPDRSGDVWDAVADLTGILLGFVLGVWVARALRARVVRTGSTRW